MPKKAKGRKKGEKSSAIGTRADGAGFPIVGIGASAGGLDAFKKFFAAMPSDSGIAFVLIPHLDPKHRSLMAELLGKQTAMPVVEAEHNMPVAANCVYVIPPNRYLTIEGGILQLSEPPIGQAQHPAIDQFFRSLAHDRQEQSIGIILSGTGSHGVLGLKEIKLVGGMVMAQDPATADYDQMPHSAVNTGMVDFVLPPEKMPEALIKYVAHPYLNRTDEIASAKEPPSELFNQILAVLRARSKYDFHAYRKNMVMRRIERRMGLSQIEELAAYVQYLRDNPDEVAALYKDLLIGVTGFFRDPEAFQILDREVISELVDRQRGRIPIRVWVPGCATGEEAYSIAMLLFEQFSGKSKTPCFQIFASDIDNDSLTTARRGLYPATVLQDIPQARLARFFLNLDESTYQVNKILRDPIIFAPQNVISDSPFSKLDLISCRNLLIYLEPEIQDKILLLFHHSLNQQGYLFLGPSESSGERTELFDAISKKWRIYRRQGPARRDAVDIPILSMEKQHFPFAPVEPVSKPPKEVAELARNALLADYAPAAVLINRKYDVLYFVGPTSDYLHFPPGEPTKDLLAMAREGLRTKIRAACHRVLRGGEPLALAHGRVKRNGHFVSCLITVRAVNQARGAEEFLLVTFEDQKDSAAARPDEVTEIREEESRLVSQLEFELKSSREDHQSTIEELESSNEELRASNEEVMSMNEELHSANEELQASKEELQSLNEELNTVNLELQDKVVELERTDNDMTNLLAMSDIAVVFLDTEFRIRRFSPSTAKLLSLKAGDVGRPLSDLRMHFSDTRLLDDCRQALEKLSPAEAEVQTDQGRWYLRRIVPYRTSNDRIGGVGVTFVDITERRGTQEDLRENEARLNAIVETAVDAIITIDERGTIDSVNPATERIFGYPVAELIGQNVRLLMPPPYCDEHDDYLRRYLETGEAKIIGIGRELTGRRKDGSTFPIDLAVSKLQDHTGLLFTGIVRDITERKAGQERLIQSERLAALGEAMAGLAHESRNALARSEGNLQRLARRLKGDQDMLDLIDAARRANDDIRRQFDEVREYAAPLHLKREPVNLGEMILQAWDHLSDDRVGRMAKLKIMESGIDLTCQIDHFSLGNAFRNILENSLAACSDPVEIHVTFFESQIGDHAALTISIRDNGPGFSPEAEQKALDAFFTTKTRGTGLGLAIVKRTVEAHDGTIEIRSLPSQGAEIVITLPRDSL